MSKSRSTRRITRSNRKSGTPPAKAVRGANSGRPRHYRHAWTRDPDALNGFVPSYAKISEAPADLVERALREKYGWIQRFVTERCPRGKLLEYARAYAQAHGIAESDIPPYTTLREWAKRYQHYGLPGLVDRVRKDAGLSRSVSAEAGKIARLSLGIGRGPADTLAMIGRVVHGELPSYDALRRELLRLRRQDPHLAAMAAHGPTYFRDLAELTLGFLAVAGGVRLSIDSTVADLWVKVPRPGGGWDPVRPVLTVVEDVGSRQLVTFNLSLFGIDSGICLGTLGRAIDPSRNYPGLTSVGVPQEIALDKGAEHQGAFRSALERLQIAVVPRRANNPRGGTHVERLIGTITTEVFKNERGYSACERPFDPYAPPDWDTKRTLKQLKYEPFRRELLSEHLLTLAELEELILAWAITYNARPHPALPENSPEVQAILRGHAALLQQPSLCRSRETTDSATNQEVA